MKGVGLEYGDIKEYSAKYFPDGTAPQQLKDGWHTVEGEEVFFEIEEGIRNRRGLSVHNESTIPTKKARNEYTDKHSKVKRSWNDAGIPLESFMLLKIYMKKKK